MSLEKKIKILGGQTTNIGDNAIIDYYENFLTELESKSLFDELLTTLNFEHPSFKMKNGKTGHLARLQSWMADEDIRERKNVSLFQKQDPHPWNEKVFHLKKSIECIYERKFDYVLINYYRNGNDMIAFHSDLEHQKDGYELVAGISLGTTRKFIFRNIKDENLEGRLSENLETLYSERKRNF